MVIARIQELSPSSQILLLGILPRNDTPSLNPKVLALNDLLSTKATPPSSSPSPSPSPSPSLPIYFHHFTEMVMKEDGSVRREMYDDHVHLNSYGYQKWSEVLAPLLVSFL